MWGERFFRVHIWESRDFSISWDYQLVLRRQCIGRKLNFKHMNLWTLLKLLEGCLWTTPIETGKLFEHQSFRFRKFRPHVKLKWKWHKFKHFGMSWYVSCAEVLLMPRPTKRQWQVHLPSSNLYLSCIYRLYACLLTRAILKLHGRIGFRVRKWSDIWVAATSASASLYPVPSQ